MKVYNDVFSSEKSDFRIENFTFEVGGQGKQQKQIEGIENAYIVKDNIEYGIKILFHWMHFGFNY